MRSRSVWRTVVATVVVCAIGVAGCSPASNDESAAEAPVVAAPDQGATERLTIGLMPKYLGSDYFNATHVGAQDAAKELGVELLYNGPAEGDVTKQAQMVDTWVAKDVDAMAVAPNDPDAISGALRKAMKRGIPVVSWDTDAQQDARNFFVNQAREEDVAKILLDMLAEDVGPDAKYITMVGSLSSNNMVAWMREIEAYRQKQYPQMTNLTPTPKVAEDSAAIAVQAITDSLKAYPDMEAIIVTDSVALPAAAEAVKKAGRKGEIYITGLSSPKTMREHVKDGSVKRFSIWNVEDLGYLTIYAAVTLAKGELKPGDTSMEAGRLGTVQIEGDEIVLGPPMIFDASNVDNFDF